IRPAELIARLVQPLNGSPGRSTVSTLWTTNGPPVLRPVSDGWPGRPSVSSSFPSGENFRTVWSPLSTVHTESSGPTVSPCGLVNSAPPQAVMNVPSGSYTSTLESYLVSRYTRSTESVPTADTSRWEIPAGSFSHRASTSYLKSAACGKSAACVTVVSPRIALSPSVSWRPGAVGLGAGGIGAGRRGAEPWQRAALPGVVEHDLDRQADGEIAVVGPDDVGHDPRALVELDVGEDERRAVLISALAAVVDGVAVDASAARRREPFGVQARAFRADSARVPDHAAAVQAALEQQPARRRRGPELLRLRIDRRRGRWQGLVLRAHASSRPRMSVAAADRVPSDPPLPCASAISQSGTCTAPLASPRSCRTASITFVIPPRFTGWLLHSPPPSVLKGSLPCGASRLPSATNAPPLPFSQNPRSSIVCSTVIVNES